MASLEELLAAATVAAAPSIVEDSEVRVSSVDPLGLRQINFDLMDRILPGLNNVADRLRPFVLMAWAWRRVRIVIERDGSGGATDQAMRDFVDRIEAIYAWSQFLLDRSAGIPGGDALADLVIGPSDTYRFGGDAWEKRRNLRRTSTGLVSPLNYGPGLRSMGWLVPVGPLGVFRPDPGLDGMLDAFEADFHGELAHPAFSEFGAVEVERDDVRRWGSLWALSDLTEAERQAGFDRLAGPQAHLLRREGLALVEAAAGVLGGAAKPDALRALMARPPGDWLTAVDLHPRADAWRRLQIRQLFRLSLEGLFHWLQRELQGAPVATAELSQRFIDRALPPGYDTAHAWLSAASGDDVVHHLDGLAEALASPDWNGIPFHIANGLRLSLTAARFEQWDKAEAFDRLPLARALAEAGRWQSMPIARFFDRVIELWVLAQHAYWCVGRGLADARGRGKTLLRLRVVIDEGGWTLTRGTTVGGAPLPTRDRLETAVSLLRECGRLQAMDEPVP